ncbi:MAG: head maturation protease, ClpP-related [Aristaeellaceae bacterium]
MNKFWNWVRNEDTGQRSLYLEGVIAQESWFGDEITPAAFKSELNAGNQPITVHINSVGGDCVAASQIYTMLMDYPADVTVQIDGLAASAASVVAMAGTKVCMSPTALMMVHNPWTNASGDAKDMQKAIALLDEVKESIINAYEIKTGMDRQSLSDLMDTETWMNAYRAKELGFCDEVLFDGDEPPEKVAFSFSSRTAEVQLMNRVKASLPEEQPVSTEAPAAENSAAPHGVTEPTLSDPPTPPELPRVRVLDADTRLEHLRY